MLEIVSDTETTAAASSDAAAVFYLLIIGLNALIRRTMAGLFITFEGIEGCGKTTQIGLFADYLRKKGGDIVLTREPGGTKIGDQIRAILLNPDNVSIFPKTELLLYAAARAQHVDEVIRPALKKGFTVISDRYADATTAYQGAARNLSAGLLDEVHRIGTENLKPDLTFLLDLPAEAGLARARKRNAVAGHEDRFENEKNEFHENVRAGYLKIAKHEPNRFIIINAGKTINEIFNDIVKGYDQFLERNNRT